MSSVQNDEPIVTSNGSDKKEKEKKKFFVLLLFLLILVGSAVFIFYQLGYLGKSDGMVIGSAVEGALSLNDDELQEALQREADEARVTVQLNGNPVFENGDAEGSLLLGNPSTNIFDMYVTITDSETDELLYDSGLIPPNHVIESDKLLVSLKAGDFPAKATVTYYDDSENVVSTSSFEITISVIN